MTRQAFIAFTFIAMIAIIILADSLGSAVAIVSLVASFFVICSIGAKMGRPADSAGDTVDASNVDTPSGAPTDAAHGQDSAGESNTDLFADSTTEESMYGSDYAQMRSYVTSYKSPAGTPLALKTASECVRDADTRVAQIGAQRTRDKASMDGAVVKDANYWRAWYGDELYQAEKAPWWGQAAY